MKLIQKTNHFSPTIVFFIEQIAIERKTTFNKALNLFLEETIKQENTEKDTKNILNEIRSIKESNVTILDVLSTILEKK